MESRDLVLLKAEEEDKPKITKPCFVKAEEEDKPKITKPCFVKAEEEDKPKITKPCLLKRKKSREIHATLNYLARIKTNVESVRCVKGRYTRSFNGCRFIGISTTTYRISTATAIPFHQQLHPYRNQEANPINSNTL